jgi:hypothetical protein
MTVVLRGTPDLATLKKVIADAFQVPRESLA